MAARTCGPNQPHSYPRKPWRNQRFVQPHTAHTQWRVLRVDLDRILLNPLRQNGVSWLLWLYALRVRCAHARRFRFRPHPFSSLFLFTRRTLPTACAPPSSSSDTFCRTSAAAATQMIMTVGQGEGHWGYAQCAGRGVDQASSCADADEPSACLGSVGASVPQEPGRGGETELSPEPGRGGETELSSKTHRRRSTSTSKTLNSGPQNFGLICIRRGLVNAVVVLHWHCIRHACVQDKGALQIVPTPVQRTQTISTSRSNGHGDDVFRAEPC